MNAKLLLSAAGAALLCASTAFAQAQPARPAGQPGPQGIRPSAPGPVIPGMCVLDEQRAIGGSAVGRAYAARMQALTQQVEAELRPLQTTLQNDVNTFQSQQATLTPEVRQQRGQALQTRANTLQQTAGTRQAELRATQDKQLNRIITEMQPVVSQVYTARNCGIMIERGTVVYTNPAMDVTDQVIQALNARISTITFERERAPAQQPAQR